MHRIWRRSTQVNLLGKVNVEMVAFDRITFDPAVLNGQPCIRGMRLSVRRVLEALATYPARDELRAEYPELEDEDIRQALEYAAANLDDRVVELPTI
jgi:uncharacterized protein (DUF433 family)